MTQGEPELEKEIVHLPDGRRLVLYRFPDTPEEELQPEPVPLEPPPPGEER